MQRTEMQPDGWLARATERFGDASAVEWAGGQWSWKQLAARVASTVRWLERAGIGQGDTIALLAPNGPAWARWLHAVAARGAVLLPLNARLAPDELAFQLADAGARLWIVGPGIDGTRLEGVRAQAKGMSIVFIDAQGKLQGGEPGATGIGSAVTPMDERGRPLAVLYTSGTTGRPKGVRLNAGAFEASARGSQRLVPLVEGDRWLVCMPLFHVGGLSILVRCALSGATSVVQGGFDERDVADALERESVTHVSLVPTMLRRLLDVRGDARAPDALRCVLLGGGAAPAGIVERAWSLGYPVVPTYGLTEACSQVATRAPGDRESPVTGRLRVLEGLELVVRDEEGRLHRAEAEGEIRVRGPSITSGYVGHAASRSPVDREGWLATGDVGRLDADGLLEVLERRDDLIVSGGENVYPAEVERALLAHPAVTEAAVVGRADAAFGARPVAFWVRAPGAPAPSAEELAADARGRLAGYKVPVAFIEIDALPRTASGKVQRARLRERASGPGVSS